MKKKIIAMLLCIVFAFSVCTSAFAAQDILSVTVSKLLEYESADRDAMVKLMRSTFGIDSGIELLRSYIIDYDESKTDTYSIYIGKFLKYYTKEDMLSYLDAMELIDEDERYSFFTGIIDRTALDLNSKQQSAANIVADYMFASNRGDFTRLCSEEGVSIGVFANMLKFYNAANGGKAPYTDSDNGGLKYNHISPAYREITESKGYGTLEQIIADINSHKDLVDAIKTLGTVTGLYVSSSQNSQNDGSQNGGKDDSKDDNKGDNPTTPTEGVKCVSYESDTKNCVGAWEVSQTGGKPVKLELDAGRADAALYRIDESGKVPVVRSVNENGKITCVLDRDGKYEAILYENPFSDTKNLWGERYISELWVRGVVNGKAEGVFEPESSVTREEFVTLIVNLFGMTSDKASNPFVDVLSTDWYGKYVTIAYNNGIINGMDMTHFGAGEKISRQDISKIILNVLEKQGLKKDCSPNAYERYADAALVGGYAREAVSVLSEMGIVSGDTSGNFNPTSYATRQEAARILYGVLSVYVNND